METDARAGRVLLTGSRAKALLAAMTLSRELLETLRCPESKGEIIYYPEGEGSGGAPFLFCPASRLRYRVEEPDLPVLLVDEAERVSEDEAERLVARARELGLLLPGGSQAPA